MRFAKLITYITHVYTYMGIKLKSIVLTIAAETQFAVCNLYSLSPVIPFQTSVDSTKCFVITF